MASKAKHASRAVWTIPDEEALMEFLIEHKSEAGDGNNFKKALWTSAATHLNTIKTRGAPKTADSCRAKYKAVSVLFYIYRYILHIDT